LAPCGGSSDEVNNENPKKDPEPTIDKNEPDSPDMSTVLVTEYEGSTTLVDENSTIHQSDKEVVPVLKGTNTNRIIEDEQSRIEKDQLPRINEKKKLDSSFVPISSLPAKKPRFMFGTTTVLSTEQSSSPDKEDVPLTEQLAMSSEEEQETLEGVEQEQSGDYWMKMITGSSLVCKDANSYGNAAPNEEAQAWSADEEELSSNVIKEKSHRNKNVDESNIEIGKLINKSVLKIEDENNNVGEASSKEDEGADSDDDLHLAIYSLGNYCKRMVRGVMCSKPKCSWVHYMTPEDAVTQFYRICSNRSARAVFRFYRFFTDLEIQEQMMVDAQELLTKTDPGEVIEIDPKNVCKAVFKAMVKVSKALDLSIDQYMEMVDISSSLYTTIDGRDTLVSLFHQTSSLIVDSGSLQVGPRLVRWCWTSLYLDSLSRGVVLPSDFYNDICTLLANQKMIGQLVTVLLYMALVPSLSPSLVHLAEVLTGPSANLTTPHSTALSTAQILSRLNMTEWFALSKLGEIKPGIELLVKVLKDDNPVDVYKFYQTVPELPGLDIPDIPAPPVTNLDCWMRQKMAEGKWEEVAYHMCSIDQQDVEVISDFAEKILLEISQLCGEFRLVDPIPELYNTMVQVVVSRNSEVHTEFIRQLGVALMVCQVTTSQWNEAGALVKVLACVLQSDFLAIKVPALAQFSKLDKGIVPLFVLEVLTHTKQRIELVKYLELWDCLSCLETEVELEKRNNIMTKVLECLATGNTDTSTVDVMIRVSDVMVLGMKAETDVLLRKRQEMMSNILFQLMLNTNMSGSRLWSRYQMVKSCNHQLHKAETRGIVMMLAYSRMIPQAKKVYQEAVKWGVYSVQATSRPLTLRLRSSMVLEEVYIIVVEFLDKLKAGDSLNLFVKMEETSTPNTGIKHLNCVRSSREEAMSRVEKVFAMLEPPLVLTKASVPYVSDDSVRKYLVLNQSAQ